MQQRLLEIGRWLKTNGRLFMVHELYKDKKGLGNQSGTNKTVFLLKNKEVYICLDWPR